MKINASAVKEKLQNEKDCVVFVYFDGDNFGLVFEYDFQNYALISKKSDDDMIYIPLDEGTEDVINQINEACDNRYLIDFSSSRTSSVSKKR